jgi:hypothetical protein
VVRSGSPVFFAQFSHSSSNFTCYGNRMALNRKELAGGDDGTRTRDLMRDRLPGKVNSLILRHGWQPQRTQKHARNGEVVPILYSFGENRGEESFVVSNAHTQIRSLGDKSLSFWFALLTADTSVSRGTAQ